MAVHAQDEQRLALFIDFENITIGVRDAHYHKFDLDLVLERLVEKGKSAQQEGVRRLEPLPRLQARSTSPRSS